MNTHKWKLTRCNPEDRVHLSAVVCLFCQLNFCNGPGVARYFIFPVFPGQHFCEVDLSVKDVWVPFSCS